MNNNYPPQIQGQAFYPPQWSHQDKGITMSESKDKPITPQHYHAFAKSREDNTVVCVLCKWSKEELLKIEAGRHLSREEAAAILKVPDSGTPWLDAMIHKARRDEFAKADYIARMISKYASTDLINIETKIAFESADALIKAADEWMGEK